MNLSTNQFKLSKVQESDDYVLALVRIGAYLSSYKTENRTKAPSREDVRDAKIVQVIRIGINCIF